MSRQPEFVEFVLERLAPMGRARARAMFGGYGIYDGATMFAIIVDDSLYFKADDLTRPEFTALGLSAFSYTARGKTLTMQYYEAPPEVFEAGREKRSPRRCAQRRRRPIEPYSRGPARHRS